MSQKSKMREERVIFGNEDEFLPRAYHFLRDTPPEARSGISPARGRRREGTGGSPVLQVSVRQYR